MNNNNAEITSKIMVEKTIEERAHEAADLIKEYEALMSKIAIFARKNGNTNEHPIEFCHHLLSTYAFKKLTEESKIIT